MLLQSFEIMRVISKEITNEFLEFVFENNVNKNNFENKRLDGRQVIKWLVKRFLVKPRM